jgi:hypothetical protein
MDWDVRGVPTASFVTSMGCAWQIGRTDTVECAKGVQGRLLKYAANLLRSIVRREGVVLPQHFPAPVRRVASALTSAR